MGIWTEDWLLLGQIRIDRSTFAGLRERLAGLPATPRSMLADCYSHQTRAPLHTSTTSGI